MPTYDDCVALYEAYFTSTNPGQRSVLAEDFQVCTSALQLAEQYSPIGSSMQSIMTWFAPTLTILLFAHLAVFLTRWRAR